MRDDGHTVLDHLIRQRYDMLQMIVVVSAEATGPAIRTARMPTGPCLRASVRYAQEQFR